ncbi:acetyl-CoA carboxylase [Salinicoccus halitifaciens]|uniref:Biotin carboxyl carrier protein of acetyl-CoA carboxylase n=1 Tax=Salinicoccus halitifaciens TaxID=1073415 RepID=A0ABV2EC34_9STAP|nr:acetyl-CoA carboxylase [Salinicoccus halitifaciens]MCD2137362.1 biotin carboxyl carrier domain-containing protein [Salinicoccus halitifaciens]
MSNSVKVLSPIPGVFYRRPSPDEDVYVNEGDEVKEGDIIGLVEVMKSFHELKAEAGGIIAEFKVEEEGMLEAGQEIAVINQK